MVHFIVYAGAQLIMSRNKALQVTQITNINEENNNMKHLRNRYHMSTAVQRFVCAMKSERIILFRER